MPSIAELLLKTPLGKAIQKSMSAQLTTGLTETDSNFYPGSNMSAMYRDRYDYDRKTILAECLRAWRVNPIARRIVILFTQFIIGEGMVMESVLISSKSERMKSSSGEIHERVNIHCKTAG